MDIFEIALDREAKCWIAETDHGWVPLPFTPQANCLEVLAALKAQGHTTPDMMRE